ncbi:MAG: haloacid dehalogenase, partial [Gammaproteobacteria bacterium]|nr:haloacid dehalogenase [Gammaproteobacteria bacterium]
DMEVLTSSIPAVLVANSDPEVKKEALQLAAASGHSAQLYIARGGYSHMNGNYSAGILEGVAHYHPEWCYPVKI